MKPILSSTTTLTGNGLGRLSDALTCLVTHEINGMYELAMTYPITGVHFDDLANDCIIWADSDNYTAKQGFRIYRITRPLNGIVTVYARHISYDMSGYVCQPMNQSTLTNALANLASNCVPSPCPFTFTSPRTVATAYKTATPMSLWQMMGGVQGSLLDVYGGEWDFDNYTATLRTSLGTDRGVNIRYGKNMTELEQDATIESQYGGIFPFWYSAESGTLVTLPENYITVTGGGSRVLCIDFSDEFEDAPTVSQLRTRATTYASANKVGDPQISWKVAFIPLAKSEEYKNIAALESVQLGDTVHVFYEPMNLTASARVVKTDYNVLLDRFDDVTLGRVKQNLAKIVVSQQRDLSHQVAVVKSTLEHAIDEATDFITNGAGYMRFIYDSNDELVEIVSLDDPDINQATSVWRWNNGGFGHSSAGYNGQYTTAITQNGAIVADFITAGTLTANIIRAGVLQDANGDNSWDLTTGAFTITNGSINITTNNNTTSKIELHGTGSYTLLGSYGLKMVNAVNSTTVMEINSVFTPADGAYQPYIYFKSTAGTGITNSYSYLYSYYLDFVNNGNEIAIYNGPTNGPYISVEDGTNTAKTTPTTSSITAGSDSVSFTKTTLTLTTSSKTTTLSASLLQFTNSGTIAVYNGSSSKYGALIWPDGNGAGRLILGDGTSTKWRTSLENTGLTFRDASDNVTATYPNTGLATVDLNENQTTSISSSGTAKSYTLTTGIYLLTVTRINNTSTTYDGVWLVQCHTNSHITQIVKGTNAPSPTISGTTLSLTTTSANQRVTITRLS